MEQKPIGGGSRKKSLGELIGSSRNSGRNSNRDTPKNMENTKLVKMGTWQEKKEERGAMTDSKALKHANTEDWLSLPNLVEGEENVRDSCLVIDNEEEVLISKPVARFSTEQNVEDSQFKMKHRPTEP